MGPERFRRAEELFHRALALPAGERAAFLDGACGGDRALCADVERLFRGDERGRDLLARFAPFPAPPPGDPFVGRRLGSWRLVERLAAGGMGIVYRAVRADGLFEQEAAVKLLRTELASDDLRRRFELERRTLARLEHPNIARLVDGGTTETGTPYLVMEYVAGRPIDRHCELEELPLEERLRLFVTVCHAVHFAHRNVVLHRDLKASNVLVDRHGVPKLLDFGIARLLDEPEQATRTRTDVRLLTPEYASPEQLAGRPLGTASDVYSLGVVLYELLTGRKPLRRTGSSPAEWERMVAEQEPTRPSTSLARNGEGDARALAARMRSTPARLRRRLRGDLDRIVLMALRKEPDRRYASAAQLAEDVERYLAQLPVVAREDTLAYRAQRFVRRNRFGVASAGLVLAALCGVLFATWRGRVRAEAQAGHARIEADSLQLAAELLGETFLDSSNAADRERIGASVRTRAERVRRQYAAEPHLRANLIDALGKVCLRLDLLDQAGALIGEAAEIRLAAFGPQSLESALSLASLGRLHLESGAPDEAAEAFARALRLHRELPPGVHTDVASAAGDLGVALRRLGRPQEACALHAEALGLRRARAARSEGSELPVAESLDELARALLDRGEPAAASACSAESSAIRSRVLGAAHPLTLAARTTLALARHGLGDVEGARALLHEVAQGQRALGSEGRRGLAETLRALAAVETAPRARGPLARSRARERRAPRP